MTATPDITSMDAPQATARLGELRSNTEWAGRLMKGDAAARAELDRLTRAITGVADPIPAPPADPVLAAIAGSTVRDFTGIETTSGNDLPIRSKLAAVADLRGAGLGDAAVLEGFSGLDSRTGKPFDAATVAATRVRRAERMSDKTWRDKLFSGDAVAKRELAAMSVILSSTAQ